MTPIEPAAAGLPGIALQPDGELPLPPTVLAAEGQLVAASAQPRGPACPSTEPAPRLLLASICGVEYVELCLATLPVFELVRSPGDLLCGPERPSLPAGGRQLSDPRGELCCQLCHTSQGAGI